jgi:hypothetical protein
MMPYDTYRLYQVERAKSPAEVQRADEQAAQPASAVSSLLRGITRSARAGQRLWLARTGVTAAEVPVDAVGVGSYLAPGGSHRG